MGRTEHVDCRILEPEEWHLCTQTLLFSAVDLGTDRSPESENDFHRTHSKLLAKWALESRSGSSVLCTVPPGFCPPFLLVTIHTPRTGTSVFTGLCFQLRLLQTSQHPWKVERGNHFDDAACLIFRSCHLLVPKPHLSLSELLPTS